MYGPLKTIEIISNLERINSTLCKITATARKFKKSFMRIQFLIVCLLLAGFLQAQEDSIEYFREQLRKKPTDSSRALYNQKLSQYYLDRDPVQSLHYSKNSIESASLSDVQYILCAAKRIAASSYLNLGKDDSSFLYATQSLALARELGENTLLYNSLGTLGNVYFNKNELPQAKNLFDEALELAKVDSFIPHRSHIYVNLGYYYYKTLNAKKGIEILKQAENIAKDENDQAGLMDVYSCLGSLYSFTNKPDSAQIYLLTALEYFHNTNKLRKEAIINKELGISYGRIYNETKMEQYLDKAYNQFNSAHDYSSAVNSLVQKALLYFSSFRLEKCSRTLNLIETESRQYGLIHTLAFSYQWKAALFGLVGDSVNAKKFQKVGEDLSKEDNSPQDPKINVLLKAISTGSLFNQKPGDSLSKKILSILQEERSKEIMEPRLQNLVLNKQLLNSNPGDFAQLFRIIRADTTMDTKRFIDSIIRQPIDSNLIAITNRQLLELETRYRTKQKGDSLQIQSQQLTISKQQVQTRNVVLGIIGLSVVFLSVLIFIIYSSYKKEKKDKTRIVLLQKELQHKVKNDLAILIRLAEVTAKKEEGNISLKELENRIKSIANVHEQLYGLNDTSGLNFKTFAAYLNEQIQKSFGTSVQFINNIDPEFKLSTDKSTPLALITNELMTNSFKYAFKDTGNNHISIAMKNDEKGICFYYHDNGPGVTSERNGFGFKLIQGLSSQLNGAQRIWNEAGFNYELIIPT